MPELPDVTLYIEALDRRIVGQPLEDVRLSGPSLLKTAVPPLSAAKGRRVLGLRRVGKRIVIGLEGDLWLVLHLMIAGRLHWRERGAKLARRLGLAAFDFPDGSLVLTEFGPRKRASLHLVQGEEGLGAHDPGGLEVEEADLEAFRAALMRENHTLKRDPEARAHRSAPARRHRQRLFGRDPARCAPFAARHDAGPLSG